MASANGFIKRLEEEQEREKLRKSFFDIRDLDRISEINPGSMTEARALLLNVPMQTLTENLLENLFSDRLQFTCETISQINDEIRIRKNILFETHSEIDKDVKALEVELHRFELCGFDRGVSILRANTRTQITQLEKEQRQSLALAWDGLTRSRQQLRGYIEKYESLTRTRALLQI